MKLTDYIILLCGIFITILLMSLIRIDRTAIAEEAGTEYSNMLITATFDSLTQTKMSKEGQAFSDPAIRKETIEKFYKSLEVSFNTNGSADMNALVRLKVPVIALVDTNGFYIYYNEYYTDNNGDYLYKTIETPIQTWTLNDGNYICRFNLNDTISVYDKSTGASHEGNYNDVRAKTSLTCFYGEEDFKEVKINTIIGSINDTVEYYINNHNDAAKNDVKYTFTMSSAKGENWAKMLSNPTIIGFLQGDELSDGNKNLNLFSIAGSEVKVTSQVSYVIDEHPDGNVYYHVAGCEHIINIVRYGKQMIDCIKSNALPCPYCN